VTAGETVTCTFVNRKRGTITIVKDAQPDDPQDFSFTAGGGLSPSSFSLDDDSNGTLSNTRTFTNLPAGSGYSVAEDDVPGWDLSSATCDDGSLPSNIDLGSGENVTCTFVNKKQGTIVAVKDAQPNDPQDFNFTAGGGLSPSSFSLDDDSDGTLPNTQTFANVPAGSGYSLSESVPSGWDQLSATCDDGSPVSNINVAPAEAVTCTFTNRKRGKIVVVKNAIPDDPQDFSFTAGGGLSPSSFSLDDDSDATLSNTQTLNNVVPGSGYSVSESVPSGWVQVDTDCSDGSPVSNVDVSAGETVTCTFVNSKSFVRPKSASPVRVGFVPAYQPCVSPNRMHGPPLASPSCNPPTQTSGFLTVGSPDANGQTANSVGRLRFTAIPGDPSTPADEADVSLNFSLTDVRNKADLSDYAGELQANVAVRITDKLNGPSQAESGTVTDTPITMTVPCSATPDTAIGASCSTFTTMDALVPGAIPEGKRTIWALDDVEVFDGGADGVASTPGNTLFARQGLFIP
jgi:hypothetical protein